MAGVHCSTCLYNRRGDTFEFDQSKERCPPSIHAYISYVSRGDEDGDSKDKKTLMAVTHVDNKAPLAAKDFIKAFKE